MTTPPPVPPERQSFYPEPHRAPQWQDAPTPRRRTWVKPVVIAAGSVGLLAAIVVAGLAFGHDRGSSAVDVTNPDGVEINAIQADTGTCLEQIPDDGSVARVTAVPCEVAHRAEVVSTVAFSESVWPGAETVSRKVLDECGAFIQPGSSGSSMFQPRDWQDGLRWVAWLPTEESWASDERSGRCVVYRDAGLLGSFVAGTATFAN